MELDKINALGQIIDTSWGRSSTNKQESSSRSITCQLLADDTLLVKYITIMHVFDKTRLHERKEEELKDGLKLIKQAIKSIESEYKEETGKAVHIKLGEHNDSVEYVSMNPHNLRHIAYYRITAHCKVS